MMDYRVVIVSAFSCAVINHKWEATARQTFAAVKHSPHTVFAMVMRSDESGVSEIVETFGPRNTSALEPKPAEDR